MFCSMLKEDESVRIKYPASKREWDFKTSFKEWLSGELEFSGIEGVEFGKGFSLATVEWDVDTTMYVIVPTTVFSMEKGTPKVGEKQNKEAK